MIRLITGGARSGKSTLAEKMILASPGQSTYIATAVPFDEGMKDRIKKHQESRSKDWATIERYQDFDKLLEDPDFIHADNILFDCVTVMVTNLMVDSGIDFDTCPIDTVNHFEQGVIHQIETLIEVLKTKNTVIVTNELGSGLVPPYKMGNYFRDIAGRANQRLAAAADAVYVAVCGIGVQISPEVETLGSVRNPKLK